MKILGVHFLALLNQTLNKTIALLTGQGREKGTGWVPWRQKKETGRRAEKEKAEGRGRGRGDSKMNPKKQGQKPIKRAWKRKTMF